MCNKMIPTYTGDPIEAEPIPECGTGWKLFNMSQLGQLSQLCKFQSGYQIDEKGWVTFSDPEGIPRHEVRGFCFFRSQEKAVRCLDQMKKEQKGHNWSWLDLSMVVVRKIFYQEGLIERNEYNFTNDCLQRVCLARQFRLTKGEGELQ